MSTYHSLIREKAGLPAPKGTDEEIAKKELDDQVADMSRSIKVNWLQEEPTRELFKSFSKQVEELEIQARLSACTYHIHNNSFEIIQLLIKAETIRNIIKKYGNTGS